MECTVAAEDEAGMQAVVKFESVLSQMEKQPSSPDTFSVANVAQELGKLFRVAPDEVALLELIPSTQTLRFALPEKFRALGSIPLTSATSLAARTARLCRSEILNAFSATRHPTVFEGVPLGRRQGQIHKIMSVPIMHGDTVIGVAQISRKGATLADSGPDFTARDLAELQEINDLLARALKLCCMNSGSAASPPEQAPDSAGPLRPKAPAGTK
jgi:hypothetical protein